MRLRIFFPCRSGCGGRNQRGPADGFQTYRIAVGKRHKVEPRQIVGALANEGGLSRADFGAIKILPDFSLVDLPTDLSQETLRKLANTRISGKLIEMRVDKGPTGGRSSAPYKGGKGKPPGSGPRKPPYSK